MSRNKNSVVRTHLGGCSVSCAGIVVMELVVVERGE